MSAQTSLDFSDFDPQVWPDLKKTADLRDLEKYISDGTLKIAVGTLSLHIRKVFTQLVGMVEMHETYFKCGNVIVSRALEFSNGGNRYGTVLSDQKEYRAMFDKLTRMVHDLAEDRKARHPEEFMTPNSGRNNRRVIVYGILEAVHEVQYKRVGELSAFLLGPIVKKVKISGSKLKVVNLKEEVRKLDEEVKKWMKLYKVANDEKSVLKSQSESKIKSVMSELNLYKQTVRDNHETIANINQELKETKQKMKDNEETFDTAFGESAAEAAQEAGDLRKRVVKLEKDLVDSQKQVAEVKRRFGLLNTTEVSSPHDETNK